MNENKNGVLMVFILCVVIAGQGISYIALDSILKTVLTDRPTQIVVTLSGNETTQMPEIVTETGQNPRVDVKMENYATKQKDTGFGTGTAINNTDTETSSDYVFFRGRWIPCGTLTRAGGVNGFEGHGETYYNLDMSGVISNAADHGITGEVWVNENGCKMLGDYIMCAAHPSKYGQVIGTSLGLGIVVDTGDFYYTEPEQVDIAVTW